jgi:hypothetical protein
MTAAEWDACSDPERMLEAIGQRLTNRKLQLFGCGCARQVWDQLPEWGQEAVSGVEQTVDEKEAGRLEAAFADVRAAILAGGPLLGLTALMFRPQFAAPLLIRLVLRGLPSAESAATSQAAILRCVAGNPFRRLRRFRPVWRTSDVLALAAGAYAENAFDRLPILADALQDAGCTDERMLTHLRSPGPHTRGCWALDLILGKG